MNMSLLYVLCSDANDDLVLTGKGVEDLFKLQSQVTNVNTDLLPENDDDDDNDNHDDSDHELRAATDMQSENREADVCRYANMSNDNVPFDNNVNIVNGATDTRGTFRAQCSADAETLRQEQLEDETLNDGDPLLNVEKVDFSRRSVYYTAWKRFWVKAYLR